MPQLRTRESRRSKLLHEVRPMLGCVSRSATSYVGNRSAGRRTRDPRIAKMLIPSSDNRDLPLRSMWPPALQVMRASLVCLCALPALLVPTSPASSLVSTTSDDAALSAGHVRFLFLMDVNSFS